jgi:hypothetical protein
MCREIYGKLIQECERTHTVLLDDELIEKYMKILIKFCCGRDE